MERLCTEPIPDEELDTVKSYMLGELIRTISGGFNCTDNFISLLANELNYSFHEKATSEIRLATAKELQDLAIKYFNPEAFYEVVAGGIEN
jgi:predicted Zn-dependent peptidase